jgi:transcriptional regulator with XRE-family HTH domain
VPEFFRPHREAGQLARVRSLAPLRLPDRDQYSQFDVIHVSHPADRRGTRQFPAGNRAAAPGRLRLGYVDFADALKDRRTSRRLSQLELALRTGTTQRHLSFIESGRSVPGREMVVRLTESLGLPLRERNELLLKAGYAPVYPETALDGPGLAPVLAALTHILDAHMPYPAIVIDRYGEIVAANAGQQLLADGCAAHVRGNAYRLALHPDGMAPLIANFADWGWHVLNAMAAELARKPRRPFGRAPRRAEPVRAAGPRRTRSPGLRRATPAAHPAQRTAPDDHHHQLRHRGRRHLVRAETGGVPARRPGHRRRADRAGRRVTFRITENRDTSPHTPSSRTKAHSWLMIAVTARIAEPAALAMR